MQATRQLVINLSIKMPKYDPRASITYSQPINPSHNKRQKRLKRQKRKSPPCNSNSNLPSSSTFWTTTNPNSRQKKNPKRKIKPKRRRLKQKAMPNNNKNLLELSSKYRRISSFFDCSVSSCCFLQMSGCVLYVQG